MQSGECDASLSGGVNMTKEEIPVDLLCEKIMLIEKLYMKRNAELRKMTSGDFKYQRWLAAYSADIAS
jgi:hypothetical protein